LLRFLLTVGVASALVFIAIPAQAQVARSGYTLPLLLAMESAAEAVRVCESNGYAVSASVVDVSGVVKLQAKGDHSTIHTRDSSFRKAYTVVTLAPIFRRGHSPSSRPRTRPGQLYRPCRTSCRSPVAWQ
jgi:hypothetical protein